MCEVVVEVENFVMLYLVGKDLFVMFYFVMKVFYLFKFFFFFMYVDIIWKFCEMIEFWDNIVVDFGLDFIVYINYEGVK